MACAGEAIDGGTQKSANSVAVRWSTCVKNGARSRLVNLELCT